MKGEEMAAVCTQMELLEDALAAAPAPSPMEFRGAMGSFATGITIVTALGEDGKPIGLTANSFNSVSLTPALVLWSLSKAARSMAVFRHARHYAINVLAADQRALAERFAGRVLDRFAGVEYRSGLHGCPVIEGAAAVFECASKSRHEEGDHVIFVGEVQACSHRPEAQPLVFHQGRYCIVGPGRLAAAP
jgi:flavin reductase (DIM6/NTAB) family NADH-FMN oxidoreductase RutF